MSETRLVGGNGERAFPDTEVHLVHRTASKDPAQRCAALDELYRRYGKPLLCFLTAWGLCLDDAKDQLQGFFAFLCEKEALSTFDPAVGRFRTYILKALKQYLARDHRSASGVTRAPKNPLVRLDQLSRPDLADLRVKGRKEEDPDEAYTEACRRELAMRAVEHALQAFRKKPAHLAALEHLMKMEEPERASYAELAQASGLTENQVRHLLFDFRKRASEELARAVKREASDVPSEQEEVRRTEDTHRLLRRGPEGAER